MDLFYSKTMLFELWKSLQAAEIIPQFKLIETVILLLFPYFN